MRHLSFAALCGLAFAAPLLAQSPRTIPTGYLNTMGSGSTSYPFGRTTPTRIQYLYRADLAGIPVVPISQVAIRGNDNATNPAKTQVELEIQMSTTKVDIFSASTTFAANRGNDHGTVFAKRMVNLPAQTAQALMPFATVFKLDKPYVWIRANGNFLIEYVITNSTTGGYSHDTEYNGTATITPQTKSCGLSQTVSGARATATTSTTTFQVSGGAASSAYVFALGAQRFPTTVTLPYGGCSFDVFPLLLLTGVFNGSGTASLQFQTPVGMRGLTVLTQWIGVTPSTWSTSEMTQTTIGGYLPHGRIYDLSSATSTTGSVQIGSGVIHEVR